MKKRQLISTTVAAALVITMTLFSCSSNNGVNNEDGVAAADGQNGDKNLNEDLKELTQNSGETTNTETPPPSENNGDALGMPADNGNVAGNTDPVPPPSENPPADVQPPADAPPADLAANTPPPSEQTPAEPLPSDTTPPPSENPPVADTSGVGSGSEGDALGVPSDADVNKAREELRVAQQPDSQAVAELLKDDNKPAKKARRRRRGGGGGYAVGSLSVPRIPARAIHKKNITLNRFYFVRAGNTPKNVSQLLYGNESQAKQLKAWNRGAWTPGRLIYYSSTAAPQDEQMRSFYQERGVQAEEYVLQKGDKITTVAKAKLGSPKSYTEIAVVNGLDSPASLTPGQKLAIYPMNLAQYGGDTARAETVPDRPSQQQARVGNVPGASGIEGQGGETVPPPTPESAPPAMSPTPDAASGKDQPFKKKSTSKFGLDPMKLLEQNLPFIALAGVVIGLLSLLMFVNKRRKSKTDDSFGEEGFSPRAKRR